MAALLMGVLAAVPARADESKDVDNPHPDVSNQLAFFKLTALDMRTQADRLDSMTPSRQLDWRTHAQSLETLKAQVNQLGRTLASLEELKSQANQGQRMAIENARPHLVIVAQEVTRAIDLLSDDRQSVYQLPYSGTVSNLHNHASTLYETVDTIMDYEDARIRLVNLDLSTSVEGS